MTTTMLLVVANQLLLGWVITTVDVLITVASMEWMTMRLVVILYDEAVLNGNALAMRLVLG